MLAPFLDIYQKQLNGYLKQLMSDKYLKHKIANNVMGSKALGSLGSRPRSTRVVQHSATDEKMILEV